jgi:hypothetical protein
MAGELADPAQRADQLRRLDREEDGLGVGRGRELADRVDIFLGDEIVDRLGVAAGDRVGDDLVALASASAARSRASASRKAASRRPSASRIWPCFSPSALRISEARLPSASRMTARFSRSAFIWRPMALTMSAGGRMSLISTRVILTPQALGRLVDHGEQPRVDLVALGEGLVEVHRAHHGAQGWSW